MDYRFEAFCILSVAILVIWEGGAKQKAKLMQKTSKNVNKSK